MDLKVGEFKSGSYRCIQNVKKPSWSMGLKICEFNLAVSVSMDLKLDVFNMADLKDGFQGWRVQIWMISMYFKFGRFSSKLGCCQWILGLAG